MTQKTVRSIRLFGLLVAQLCAYSMLSALCFACPLYLFDCSGSSTLYGAVAAIAFIPGVLATPVGGFWRIGEDIAGFLWYSALF